MIKGLNFSKKEHISALRQSCQRQLQCVFNRFFELASSTLLTMADSAETNRLQALYLDAQRLVRTRRSAIESLLFERTMDSFSVLDPDVFADNAHGSHHPTSQSPRYNHLELLGNEDLEVMIALDNGTTKALETFKPQLYLLQRRFHSLAGSELDAAKPMPLSPDALLECFSESICDDLIAVEIQVVLINLFSQVCFDPSYGQLLEDINLDLEEAGVFPMPEEPSRNPSPPSPVAESQSVYTGDVAVDINVAEDDPEQRQAVVDKLKTRRYMAADSPEPLAEYASQHCAEAAL